MRFGVLLFIAGALSLAACAKEVKDTGVDDGYCKQTTIDAYNNVIGRGFWKSNSEDTVTTSCKKMQDLLGGRSCKAQKTSTGEESMLSYSDIQNICEPKSSKGGTSASTPIPAPETKTSKYVGSDGRCTPDYKRDVKALKQSLNGALKYKNKKFVDLAKILCGAMDRKFNGLICRTYDSKKQEFVNNSVSSGNLGQLCDGAQKIGARFAVQK